MGEEACSDRRATPQISTTDVFPNTPSPGRTKKYSWMLMCTVWWCLLEHILSAGFYYDKVHQGTNANGASSNSNSVSQVLYEDTGFLNQTQKQLKFMTTAQGGRLCFQRLEVSTEAVRYQQDFFIVIAHGFCSNGKFVISNDCD